MRLVATMAGMTLALAAFSACNGSDPSQSNPSSPDAATSTPDGSTPGKDAAPPTDGGTPDGDAAADAAVVGKLFAFVGSDDGKIRSYEVDAAGAWTFRIDSAAGNSPSFLAFDPPRRRIVSTDEGAAGMVRSFSFDPATGALTAINARSAGGSGTTHVSFDPTGQWVFAANYNGGSSCILPIAANGTLAVATDTKSSGAMSHWAGTSPSGKHVFVPALGANVVTQYTLDAVNGKLVDNGNAPLPGGAGPRHLTFHPNEKWAYTINELANTVTTFDFDKVTGKLTAKQTISALPPGTNQNGVSGAEIQVHPSGKRVYASTRGYNSIVRLEIDAVNGTLTRAENTMTGGNQPRSFGMDPEGTLLFAGNQAIGQVVGFKIDATTGALTWVGNPVDVPTPTLGGLARIP
jgi:6-phosphogluconolactonase